MEDELNPKFMFNMTRRALLLQALNGEFSLEHMARYNLAGSGMDCETGAWIGFEKAGEQLKNWERANVPEGQWLA